MSKAWPFPGLGGSYVRQGGGGYVWCLCSLGTGWLTTSSRSRSPACCRRRFPCQICHTVCSAYHTGRGADQEPLTTPLPVTAAVHSQCDTLQQGGAGVVNRSLTSSTPPGSSISRGSPTAKPPFALAAIMSATPPCEVRHTCARDLPSRRGVGSILHGAAIQLLATTFWQLARAVNHVHL